jgi:hypothetical protein
MHVGNSAVRMSDDIGASICMHATTSKNIINLRYYQPHITLHADTVMLIIIYIVRSGRYVYNLSCCSLENYCRHSLF